MTTASLERRQVSESGTISPPFARIREILTSKGGKSINQLTKKDFEDYERKELLTQLSLLSLRQQSRRKDLRLTRQEESVLKDFGKKYQPFIQENLADLVEARLIEHADPSYGNRFLSTDRALVKNLGLDKDPKIATLLMTPQQRSRRGFFPYVAALAGASLTVNSLDWSTSPSTSNRIVQPVAEPMPEIHDEKTVTNEKADQTEKKTYYEELLQPLIEAIQKHRLEKAQNDPEYLKRIDQELNQDRINIVVYSHGDALETDTDTLRHIGSFSVLSVNVKTGRVDAVSWTHDLRSPETERYLKAKGVNNPEPQKMYHAYNVGGTELLGKAVENLSGLSADMVLAFPEKEVANLVDKVFGTLTVNVSGDFETYPYYYDGKRYDRDQFKKGPMVMDGATVVKYIKTEAINPQDPSIVNSNRKNKVLSSMLKQAGLNFYSEAFWDKIEGYVQEVDSNNKMDSNLPLKVLVDTAKNAREKLTTFQIATAVGSMLTGQLAIPEMASSTYIVSDHFGDGGLEWAVNSENPVALKDKAAGVYTGDSDRTFVQIPFGGDPYADDLARGYYPSTRRIVRSKLGFPPLEEPTLTLPTVVSTASVIEPAPKEAAPKPEVLKPFENKVGWAYVAYPDLSSERIEEDMKQMKEKGANTVYISHNNGGEANPRTPEPGLSYAVYYAIKNKTASEAGAESMLQAVTRTIEAAEKAGLQVVLSIGYQIAMGSEWNRVNRNNLRKTASGEPLVHWHSCETASPYSLAYRRDIEDFYNWVNEELVKKHPNITAVNLADEPMGGDYSQPAEDEFRRQYGKGFKEATEEQLGEFQAGVVADYAIWSANLWKKLNPTLPTMMTFHIQRDKPFFPNIEKIFALTPDTFVFSADTHLHDALPDQPITNQDRNLLEGMTRTLGFYSAVYNKKLMLWTSANAWGLAGESKNPGGVKEALENLDIVTNTVKNTGGVNGMVMAWAYNLRTQEMPDSHQIIEAVSKGLAQKRDSLSQTTNQKPDNVVYVDKHTLYRAIGRERSDHLLDQFLDLSRIDFQNNNTIYLTEGRALTEARALGIPIHNLAPAVPLLTGIGGPY